MKTFLSFLFVAAFTIQLISQSTYASLTMSGTEPFQYFNNEVFDMETTSDGGAIMAGMMDGTVKEILLVKLDKSGSTEWMKSYGTEEWQRANAVIQTKDGGFLMVGSHVPKNANPQLLIVKTDRNGSMLWSQNYGGKWGVVANDVRQTKDGGYIITGQNANAKNKILTDFRPDKYLMKLDNKGNLQWHKNFGRKHRDDIGYVVRQCKDEGFIIAGTSGKSTDAFITKTDKSGNTEWSKRYGQRFAEKIEDILELQNGDFIGVGLQQTGSDSQAMALRVDAQGELIWANRYISPHNVAYFKGITSIADTAFVITGNVDADFGSSDIWVMKINGNGEVYWSQGIGGPGGEFGESVNRFTDGMIAVGGTQIGSWEVQTGMGDMVPYLLKLNLDGSGLSCISRNVAKQKKVAQLDIVTVPHYRNPALGSNPLKLKEVTLKFLEDQACSAY